MIRREKIQATSLIELLISAALMLLIMASVTAILLSGYSYLRSNEKALDTQRAVLLLMTKLSTELEQSDYAHLEIGGNEVPPEPAVAFVSPFSDQVNPAFNLTNNFMTDNLGNMEIQRYICYYLNTTSNQVFRNEVPYMAYSLAAGMTAPPVLSSTGTATPGIPPLNISWWLGSGPLYCGTPPQGCAAGPPLTRTLVAEGILAFNVTGYAPALNTNVVDVTVAAGDAQHGPKSPEGYYFTISSTMSPRN
jgi:hypothetical protein